MSQAFGKTLEKIEKFIKAHELISPKDSVLVAVSGGGDSVFLLRALYSLKEKLDFSLYAAHFNHSLRPEADLEEKFVKELCKCLDIPCFTKKDDVKALAGRDGISLETAGRNARYAFFKELEDRYGFSKTATAHHMDDNAETILMHFIRGSGANGLKGISARRGHIIRPLLEISKKEITEVLKEQDFDYVTDNSNFDPVYTRNRVRLMLIPEILKINPNFLKVITQNSSLFAEDEDFINGYTTRFFSENYKDGCFPKEILDKQPISVKRRIIQLIYRDKTGSCRNLSNKYIESVLALKHTGQTVSLPGRITAMLSYGRYMMRDNPQTAHDYEYKIKIGQELYIPEAGEYWLIKKAEPGDKKTFTLSEGAELSVRNRRDKDRFYPIGMNGSKSVSDFFTDKKIPRANRSTIPILTSDSKIVNIAGIHRDRRFYETSDGKNLYILKIRKDIK